MHCLRPTHHQQQFEASGGVELNNGNAWTKAQCNLLLSALKSRVSLLRKELIQFSPATEDQTSNDQPKGFLLEPSKHSEARLALEDVGLRGTKRIRTYSSKIGRQRKSRHDIKRKIHLRPGEISIATPILTRDLRSHLGALRHAAAKHDPAVHFGISRKRRRRAHQYFLNITGFQPSRSLRDICKNVSADRYAIYEGIYNRLDKLLTETASNQPHIDTKGSKSLLSACIRATPKYITEEEVALSIRLEKAGRDPSLNLKDVELQVYERLETFGLPRRGWAPLKFLARCHGIHILTNATSSGFLCADFCEALVMLCVRRSAHDEAEAILSALISAFPIPAPKSIHSLYTDEPAAQSLAILWRYVEQTGRHHYQYQALTAMICKDVLPVGWLATREFTGVWSEVLKRVSMDCNSGATEFLEAALTHLVKSGAKGTGAIDGSWPILSIGLNTTSSLLANLLSIVILGHNSFVDGRYEKSTGSYLNHEHLVFLLRGCLIRSNACVGLSIEGSLMLLANLILTDTNDFFAVNNSLFPLFIDQIRGHSRPCQVRYRAAVVFLCMISRYCGKGASTHGLEYLKNLHCTLQTLAARASGADLVARMVLDSAIAFSQEFPGQENIEYAALVDFLFQGDHRFLGQATTSNCPRARPNSSQHWEEGIGEWVTITRKTDNGLPDTIIRKYVQSASESLAKSVAELHHRQINEGNSSKDTEADLSPTRQSFDSIDAYQCLYSTVAQQSSEMERLCKHEEDHCCYPCNSNPQPPSSVHYIEHEHAKSMTPQLDLEAIHILDSIGLAKEVRIHNKPSSFVDRACIWKRGTPNTYLARRDCNSYSNPLYSEVGFDTDLNEGKHVDRAQNLRNHALPTTEIHDNKDEPVRKRLYLAIDDERGRLPQNAAKFSNTLVSSYPLKAIHRSRQSNGSCALLTDSEDELYV